MDNKRTLKGFDVPEQATNSVKSMIEDLSESLVHDFLVGLNRNNRTISNLDLNALKSHIISEVGITMAITLKCDTKLVNDLNISILPLNQSGIDRFNENE